MSISVNADEGMWLFNKLPLDYLKRQYGFVPSPGWSDHLRSAAVRFNNGGSGSFVSADGLIMTNHHIGSDTLAKLGSKDRDYYRDGFLAERLSDELKAPDLELNVLVAINDVTEQVNSGIGSDTDDARAALMRRAAMAEIEKQATEKNGLRNDVVTLYQGGQYHLYTYKKYTDVRLVFAPEFDIAFFGGDPDNFEYPRYDLDVCFFRAYENDKPARIDHFLKWSASGSREGDLVFVAGHPGRTDRINTVASLEFQRDVDLPRRLEYLRNKEKVLLEYGRRGAEQLRQSKEELFSTQNSLKARNGGLDGLRDKAFMASRVRTEASVRSRFKNSSAKSSSAHANPWDKIAAAQKVAAEIAKPYFYLERANAFDSDLFTIARDIVRLVEEKTLPNSERLEEYRESGLKSLELKIFSEAPIYPDFEVVKLAHSLAEWRHNMNDDPLCGRVLHGLSPAEAARALVSGSKLADVAFRHRLVDGGMPAIQKTGDTMINLALTVDPDARWVRKIYENQVKSVERTNYAIIARTLFEQHGSASVSRRDVHSPARVRALSKDTSSAASPCRPSPRFGGAFAHAKAHGDTPPYELPPRAGFTHATLAGSTWRLP